MERLQVLEGHTDRVWAVAWSPSGDCLASCSGDKTVRIWRQRSQASEGLDGTHADQGSKQLSTWVCVAVLEDAHTRAIRNLCWSPNGRELAMASFDSTTTIWEVHGSQWEQVACLEGHENEVKCVSWSPDGNLIATCGRDKSVWIWESLPGHEYECVDVKQGHKQDVKSIVWHPSGELLVSCSYDDSIRLWVNDGDEWVCAQTLEGTSGGGVGHASTVWGAAFRPGSPTPSHLVSCSDDCTLKFWRCTSGGSVREPRWRCTTNLTGYHSRPIYSIDWAAWPRSAWGRQQRQQQEQQQQQPQPQGGDGTAQDPAQNGPGDCIDLIATGDGDNAILIFAPAAGMDGSAAQPELGAGSMAANSDDENLPPYSLHAASRDAHTADVNCVRWNPVQAGLLASASDDGTIALWLVKPPQT